MENFYKLEVDAEQMCRACLVRNSTMENIFCSEIVDGEIVPMPNVYETVTGMQIAIDDQFPSNLCASCKQKLIDAYVFKQKCVKSMKLLRKILKVPEDDDAGYRPMGNVRKVVDKGSPEKQTINCTATNGAEVTVEDNLEAMFSELDPVAEVDEADEDDVYRLEQQNYFQVIDSENVNYLPEEKSSVEIVILRSNENANSQVVKVEAMDAIDTAAESVDDTASNDLIEYGYTTEDSLDENDVVVICDTQIKRTNISKKEATSRYKVPCLICQLPIFKKDIESHLNDHVNFLPQVVSANEFFRCDGCRSIFVSSKVFLEHLADRKTCQILFETQPDAQCTDYQYLDDPLTLNTLDNIQLICCTKTEDRKFLCNCKYQTTLFDKFREHYRNCHIAVDHQNDQLHRDTYRLNHRCGLCLRTLETLQETIFHAYYHQKQFTCPINPCGKKIFNTFGSLRRHLEREHFDGMTFPCQYCQKVYVGYELLKIHLKSECTARKMCCKFCDKKYFQKATLDIHMRGHRNEKKFKCEYCPKMFVQSNDLKNHQRIHTGERPFHCPMCPKAFKTISCRLDHMKTHDEDSTVECLVCHKTFKSSRILRGHMRLHTEKSFKCEICSKKFHRQYHLKLHTKVHQENNEMLSS